MRTDTVGEQGLIELAFYVVVLVMYVVLLFWQGERKLNARMIVAVTLLGAFLLAVSNVVAVEDWSLVSDREKLTYAFYIVASLAVTAVGFWVWKDGIEIEELKKESKN